MEHFATEGEAHRYFAKLTQDLDYKDNLRCAYVGNEIQEYEYERAVQSGCCGSLDIIVMVGENEFRMGCNYGH